MISKVKKALVTAFVSGGFFPTANVAFPNARFAPPSDRPWARFSFLPNNPQTFGLGTEGTDLMDGIAQIDLNFPPDSGDGAALGKADDLRALFWAGNRFSFDGVTVIVKNSGYNGGAIVDGVFRVVFTLSFYSVISR